MEDFMISMILGDAYKFMKTRTRMDSEWRPPG